MVKANEYHEFRFDKLRKSGRRSESSPLLKIYVFQSDKSDKVLYTVAALDCYIEKTSIWRKQKPSFTLLVDFIKPDNAVAKSIVAPCWVNYETEIKTEIVWNKIQGLHKAEKWL